MFLPVNPWASYQAEDIPTINYSSLSDKEYFKKQTILLGVCSAFLIGVLILTIISGLLGICWCALTIVTVPILMCWVSLIKDYVKYKQKIKNSEECIRLSGTKNILGK